MRCWASRIQLEALSWPASLFVTLTYAPENLPVTADGLATLKPRDLMLFWKRLRKALGNKSFRYFGVGEYGSQTWRPHYHAVIFGLSELDCVEVGRYVVHPAVQKAWSHGFTSAGGLNAHRAGYVSQYVTKKLTKSDDPWAKKQLAGRHPEFMRASRRPGIGALHVEKIAEALLHADPAGEDIPTSYVLNGRTWPLSTFIATKVREELGIPTLARDRPKVERERDPDDDVLVELEVGSGSLGKVKQTITRAEQKNREREAKLERKYSRKRQEAAL